MPSAMKRAVGGEEIVAPIEERVKALLSAIEETEVHLRNLGFDPTRLLGLQRISPAFRPSPMEWMPSTLPTNLNAASRFWPGRYLSDSRP